MSQPVAMTFDRQGNLFILDAGDGRIRKIAVGTGLISTVARTGIDWSSLILSRVVATTEGHLLFTDPLAHRVRKLDARTGALSTIAGTGPEGKDSGSYAGDGGPATQARLNLPIGVALGDHGDLFIADCGNNRIRKVDPSGLITTVAGTGDKGFAGDGGPASSAVLNCPYGLAVDANGDLFITGASYRVHKVTAATGRITTVAGTGERGFTGDGGPATKARLGFVAEIALDGRGHLFLAEERRMSVGRIRQLTLADGTIAAVAGGWPASATGDGFSGDDGPATAAQLSWPSSVVLDRQGDLLIADSGNNRIRKVSPTGSITSIAGTGKDGCTGDGGLATNAALGDPIGLALDDAGNLFVSSGHRIRRIAAGTGIITTVAGTGTRGYAGDGGPATGAEFNEPRGVAVGPDGSLFIADSFNHLIRKVEPGTGTITTLAGNRTPPWKASPAFEGDGGPATAAGLSFPVAVAVDRSGNLFIADAENRRIRKVVLRTGLISTVAGLTALAGGSGPTAGTEIGMPAGLALDGNDALFISKGNQIRRLALGGQGLTVVAGTGIRGFGSDGPLAVDNYLSGSAGMAYDGRGVLFVADSSNNRVVKVNLTTGAFAVVAGTGRRGFVDEEALSLYGRSARPAGLALDGEGGLLVADESNDVVRRLDLSTGTVSVLAGREDIRPGRATFAGDGGPAGKARLGGPAQIARSATGALFIADQNNHRIRKVDPNGRITTIAGIGPVGEGGGGFSGDGGLATAASLRNPAGVALDREGNLFVADSGNNRIRKIAAWTGTISTVAGTGRSGYAGDGGPAIRAELNRPLGIAVDASGNLLIADEENHRIRQVNPSGRISTVAGTVTAGLGGDGGPATSAWLESPSGVAVDAAGDMFIADTGNNRICRVSRASGLISTAVGTGFEALRGDGGPATSAWLASPTGITIDAEGNLYISDMANQRIRKVTFSHNSRLRSSP